MDSAQNTPTTTSTEQLVIAFQYNPDTLTRSFQVKGVGAEGGDRSEALRLKGPAVESFKLEAEIDATERSCTTNHKHIDASGTKGGAKRRIGRTHG
jgi:hypothetical protein